VTGCTAATCQRLFHSPKNINLTSSSIICLSCGASGWWGFWVVGRLCGWCLHSGLSTEMPYLLSIMPSYVFWCFNPAARASCS